ncbi:MAG: cupin domain-containing protein [Actinomycetota bacterium]|nr:cupin domain-containing protein [Actinomycetota bacterium]
MPASLTPRTTERPTVDELRTRFSDAGLDSRVWSNAPGDRYDWHSHEQHKILFCVEGAITFHTRDEDFLVEAGDRLDIEPGTSHAAHVHPEGVTCIEGFASGPDALEPGY